ncbi:MAG: cation-translocating P-type ATPase, partial [Candidatus Latescibacterota bacterium]
MIFGRKQKPLMHCEVTHALPGRVRIASRALRYIGDRADEVTGRLGEVPGIRSVRLSAITANVLIGFDPDLLDPETIRKLVERIVGLHALVAYKAERQEQSRLTVTERRLQDEPLSEMLTRVIVTTTALAFAWMGRHGTKPKMSLVQRFLSMPALTALSLAGPIFRNGLESLRKTRRPNADTLSATAILTSILAGRDVSALTIIWLADIAELLTAWTMDRTRKAIEEMLNVGDAEVWKVLDDGSQVRVALDDIAVGDLVATPTGEKISVDGVIVSGEATIDQASITGEFMPAVKTEGEEVFAGSVVKTGSVIVKAERVGDETAVARIVHMVQEASLHKAPIQAFADKFSAAFIPANFGLSALVYGVTKSSARALNMLIIDYSCGVRLSTATALSASIYAGARHGILIKGGSYLELLDEADTLILDKTGTLTEGKPEVLDVVPFGRGMTERHVLELAAAAEETSSHPMAVAVLDRVRQSGWRVPKHGRAAVRVARGVEARVDGSTVRVGSRRFMEESQIDVSPSSDAVQRLISRGDNIIYVGRDRELIGVLGIQDALRENMKKALNRLRLAGMDDIVLLTGDVEQHAEIVAGRMAMDRYKAEALPEDKAEMVLQLQSRGTNVVMVGDGINDAPALAYANVGIATGATRTDVAMEAADITIAGDNPLLIPGVIRLSKKTMNIIRQNFGISVGVNTIGLVLSAMGVL